jgi:hypothetical protein
MGAFGQAHCGRRAFMVVEIPGRSDFAWNAPDAFKADGGWIG